MGRIDALADPVASSVLKRTFAFGSQEALAYWSVLRSEMFSETFKPASKSE